MKIIGVLIGGALLAVTLSGCETSGYQREVVEYRVGPGDRYYDRYNPPPLYRRDGYLVPRDNRPDPRYDPRYDRRDEFRGDVRPRDFGDRNFRDRDFRNGANVSNRIARDTDRDRGEGDRYPRNDRGPDRVAPANDPRRGVLYAQPQQRPPVAYMPPRRNGGGIDRNQNPDGRKCGYLLRYDPRSQSCIR